MYEQYLQLSSIPCGAVLNRIMSKEGISQSQLAERSGIVRQRICDYLANRRRITVEASLNLEKALHIGIEGFFYRIQANHDIYTCVKEQAMNSRPNLKHSGKLSFGIRTLRRWIGIKTVSGLFVEYLNMEAKRKFLKPSVSTVRMQLRKFFQE